MASLKGGPPDGVQRVAHGEGRAGQREGRELVDHAVGAERRGDAAPLGGASGVRGPRPRYGLLIVRNEPEHVQ
jgi:hypothetical protein